MDNNEDRYLETTQEFWERMRERRIKEQKKENRRRIENEIHGKQEQNSKIYSSYNVS